MEPANGLGCRILRDVMVPMRDGVCLATTVCLPPAEGPHPVVLVRTAYNRAGCVGSGFASQGIALVVQDVRGRYGSDGDWYPFVHEADDGYDTLEWIGAQPWCNGSVGMFGDSYLAATQFYVAPTGSRYLKALNPRFMAGDIWRHAYYCDGVFSLALTHSWLCFETSSRTSDAALLPLFEIGDVLRGTPLVGLDEACGSRVPAYRDYVSRYAYDDAWQALNVREQMDRYTVPVLLTGGWYDYYAGETFENYRRLCDVSPVGLASRHRVIVGPWTHGINQQTVLGELDFGAASLTECDSTERWLACTLRDGCVSDFQEAPIRIFVMGRNEWRNEHEWPLRRTAFTPLYLHSSGHASSEADDGVLSGVVPSAEPVDAYAYDPCDPAPTRGGNHSVGPYNPGLYDLARPGPYDQRPVEQRADFLVYTTSVLEDDLEITGPIVVKLFASSSAPDTDFVARLVDVYPDGRAMNITEGVIRARYQHGDWRHPTLIEPGTVYAYTINLQPTSNVFLRGHRLRLDITSSNFPLWDRNPNTGDTPGQGTRFAVAHQEILHTAEYPSRIILPVIPGSLA